MSTMPEVEVEAEARERLRDAYLALGTAIADLRSSPMRDHSGPEEALHFGSAQRAIGEAQVHSKLACEKLGVVAPGIDVEPSSFGGGRALARTVVWEWIADLQAARAALAAIMRQHGAQVPDDLPEGSALERWAGTPAFRNATTAAFGLLLVAGIVALVVSLFTS